MTDTMTFTIKCTMRVHWVPHFLGMLKRMQHLGAIGSSRLVSFYSDGDGNFRPHFEWGDDLPVPAKPAEESAGGNVVFDTG